MFQALGGPAGSAGLPARQAFGQTAGDRRRSEWLAPVLFGLPLSSNTSVSWNEFLILALQQTDAETGVVRPGSHALERNSGRGRMV